MIIRVSHRPPLRREDAMTYQRNPADDSERLPADAAHRLLARASELEAASTNEITLAELREAAREAGIPATAFEEALTELRLGLQPVIVEPGAVPRKWPVLFWAGVVPALLTAAFVAYALLRVAP
jgi:hypothetical protein